MRLITCSRNCLLRYTSAIGKFALHPLDKRKIPIVADDILVDMNFGTGAVKITPAHDPNDFEVGKRHGLEFINVLTDDGSLNARGKQFEGLPRFTVRSPPHVSLSYKEQDILSI